MMINQINNEQIDDILKKSQEVEKMIEANKLRQQEINNKLIEFNTKKQQILEELQKLGITEETLDSNIQTLYTEVKDELARFDQFKDFNRA